jgi:hypothetical protein
MVQANSAITYRNMNKIVQIVVPLLSFSSGAFVLASSASEYCWVDNAQSQEDGRNISKPALCFDIHDQSRNSVQEEHTFTPDMNKPIEFGAFIGAMAH